MPTAGGVRTARRCLLFILHPRREENQPALPRAGPHPTPQSQERVPPSCSPGGAEAGGGHPAWVTGPAGSWRGGNGAEVYLTTSQLALGPSCPGARPRAWHTIHGFSVCQPGGRGQRARHSGGRAMERLSRASRQAPGETVPGPPRLPAPLTQPWSTPAGRGGWAPGPKRSRKPKGSRNSRGRPRELPGGARDAQRLLQAQGPPPPRRHHHSHPHPSLRPSRSPRSQPRQDRPATLLCAAPRPGEARSPEGAGGAEGLIGP